MLFLISEKVAALYQRFQHAEINFFVGPFAFGKEGGIFVLLAHNVNFCLSFMDRIVIRRVLMVLEVAKEVGARTGVERLAGINRF